MLQLSSCMVFQRPGDSKILFVKRKESDLWGLPGGKLNSSELHQVQFFSFSNWCKKPDVEIETIDNSLALLSKDALTLAAFLGAAIREGEEETGLSPEFKIVNFPFAQVAYSVKPLHCASIDKEFFTVTFYCGRFYEDLELKTEDLELRWEESDFLLSEEIFVPDYNSEIFQLLKGLK